MFKNKPPLFSDVGKPKVSLTMYSIKEWDDGGWGIASSYYVPGEIEGGHEAIIWGSLDDYWRDGNEVVGVALRMHVKITSDLSRREFERGIIGGGQIYDQYVEIELNLEPDQTRDIVNELRLSHSRQVHIGGYAISEKIFRVTKFGFSEPRDET